MSEDHTRSVTVKRSSKKKSGYLVEETDGEYFISEVPAKARLNIGDKVVGINGIKADEFVDQDDANGLIESIRIVVVPEDEIEEYEAAGGDAAEGKAAAAAPAGKNVYHCSQCDHDNEDLSEDEDGDLVCEECGTVIDAGKTGGMKCVDCGHENHNLERDEEGDYVCEECGAVIPEQNALAIAEQEEEKKIEYECPDCGHITINPEPDDEGDRICEECGCILPEKLVITCDDCGQENIDPSPNEKGEYICEKCGVVMAVEEIEKSAAEKLKEKADAAAGAPAAAGQEFGDDGKPTTNKEGKKLTPADMFNPGDVITVTVGKSNPKQDCGLKIEKRENQKVYVRKVPPTGLFARTPVIAGDKLLELNGKETKEYENIDEMKLVMKEEERITVVVLRREPDASDSSASSGIDYDNLAAIKPDGQVDRQEIEEQEDDTEGYDGEDCGCLWCPDCHP